MSDDELAEIERFHRDYPQSDIHSLYFTTEPTHWLPMLPPPGKDVAP